MLDYVLPTDVVDVHVERGGTKRHPELGVRVERKLPAAAYVLLAGSIACASMDDISMELLVRATAFKRGSFLLAHSAAGSPPHAHAHSTAQAGFVLCCAGAFGRDVGRCVPLSHQ